MYLDGYVAFMNQRGTKRRVSKDGKIRVLIVGAGDTGTDLFNTIIDEPGIVLTGIFDGNNEFSSFDLAGPRNTPVFNDISEAMRTMPDIAFHLDKSGVDSTEIMAHKPTHTEIIGHQGVRFFLNMIRHSRLSTMRQIHQHKEQLTEGPANPSGLDHPTVSISTSDSFNNSPRNEGRRLLNILCIDDDPGFLDLLRGILEPAGYNVISARTGQEGMEQAIIHRPELIILDLLIQDMDGLDLSLALKNNAATVGIPVMIITAQNVTVGERLKLAGKIESLMQKNCFCGEDLLAHIDDLEITYPVRVGLLDTVSGLFDRSYFEIRLAQEISRADRHKTVFSILLADIDRFSEYARISKGNCNTCIQEVADFLLETTRGSDVLIRYGSDKFALLLTSSTEDATHIVARRLLSFIENCRFPGVEELEQGKLTVSVATVHYDRIGPCAPEKMISKAEELIREAKKEGGGNIKIYGMTCPPDIDPQLQQVFGQHLEENLEDQVEPQ